MLSCIQIEIWDRSNIVLARLLPTHVYSLSKSVEIKLGSAISMLAYIPPMEAAAANYRIDCFLETENRPIGQQNVKCIIFRST